MGDNTPNSLAHMGDMLYKVTSGTGVSISGNQEETLAHSIGTMTLTEPYALCRKADALLDPANKSDHTEEEAAGFTENYTKSIQLSNVA